ncbi:MAG: hypothetical protein KAX49_20710 [Halanaerobiales bacterium]|nr:hypothetical protein [Halanaerobiales bacterium]
MEEKNLVKEDKFHVDDEIMYKNVLGEWHKGIILKVNNTTIRILNANKFKILSIKRPNVMLLEEYSS